MSRWKTIQKLILNNFLVDGIVDAVGGNSHTKLITQYAVDQAIAALNLSGNNKLEVVNIRDFGVTPNAVIPGSGNTVTGTSIHTAINTAITQLSNNQILYGGPGNWLCSTSPNALSGQKTFNWLIDGNIYTNGSTFLTVNQPGGVDRVHTIIINGKIFGRVNDVTHTRSRWQAGTGPDFTTYTGQGILINQNVNSMHLKCSVIDGFESGIKMVAAPGNGSQENTFAIQKLNNNRYGIHLEQATGGGWLDKNHFHGFDGGNLRISGDVALKIQGNPSNNFAGAFRSNRFKFLAESVTRIMEVNGDVTEPLFELTIEAGLATGVFDQANGIQCRIASPNRVRSPKWNFQGVFNTLWMQNGMGVDGRINGEVYLPDVNGDATTLVGDFARIDGNGNINIEVKTSFSAANRAALPSNFRPYITQATARNRVVTASASYTVGTDDYIVDFNATSGNQTANLPSASSNMGREIVLRKIELNNSLSIAGTDSFLNASLPSAKLGTIVVRADETGSSPEWRIKAKWFE